MNHIENLQGEAFPLTGYREMKRIRRVNGEKELTFTLLRTPQNDRYFDDFSYLWDVHFDQEPYKALLLTDTAQGNGYTREVAAIHTFYDDLRSVYQPVEKESATYTFEEALEHAKVDEAGYQWNFIDTFDSDALEFENFGQDNGLAMFLHALGRWDAEFYVNGEVINIVAERGNDTDFQFRYQVNLDSMEREIDAMDFATVVYGYGKNDEETGEPLVSVEYRNEEMIEAFGVRETSYTDERYTKDEEGLLERIVEKHQKESLKVSYTFDFFDLRDAGYPRQLPQEGDRILLIDERLNVKLETRIMEIEETFDEDDNIIDCQVTVSNFNTMQTQQERDQQATQAMADAIEGKQALPFQALAYAVRRATMQLQNTETQFVIQENGTWLAVDLENENNVVSYNAAGIGISTDAGQSYETAMTAEGIVATTITSGTIRTNNVRIEGASGNMYMDGDRFVAQDADDPDSNYTIIEPGNHEIRGTGYTVIRPDGYPFIMDGIAVADYNVQGQLSPPIDPSIGNDNIQRTTYGYRFTTTSQQPLEYFGFRHQHQYLNIQVQQQVEFSSMESIITVETTGSSPEVLAENRTSNTSSDYDDLQNIITVDLGKPTGNQRNLWVRAEADSENEMFVAILRMWMSG